MENGSNISKVSNHRITSIVVSDNISLCSTDNDILVYEVPTETSRDDTVNDCVNRSDKITRVASDVDEIMTTASDIMVGIVAASDESMIDTFADVELKTTGCRVTALDDNVLCSSNQSVDKSVCNDINILEDSIQEHHRLQEQAQQLQLPLKQQQEALQQQQLLEQQPQAQKRAVEQQPVAQRYVPQRGGVEYIDECETEPTYKTDLSLSSLNSPGAQDSQCLSNRCRSETKRSTAGGLDSRRPHSRERSLSSSSSSSRTAIRLNKGGEMKAVTVKLGNVEGGGVKHVSETDAEERRLTEEEKFRVIGVEGVTCKLCKRQLRTKYQSLQHARGLCHMTGLVARQSQSVKTVRLSESDESVVAATHATTSCIVVEQLDKSSRMQLNDINRVLQKDTPNTGETTMQNLESEADGVNEMTAAACNALKSEMLNLSSRAVTRNKRRSRTSRGIRNCSSSPRRRRKFKSVVGVCRRRTAKPCVGKESGEQHEEDDGSVSGVDIKTCFISLNRNIDNSATATMIDSNVVPVRPRRERSNQRLDLSKQRTSPRLRSTALARNSIESADNSKTNISGGQSVIDPDSLTVVAATAPCVCDGCGEVVPDCSWLTAHIVTCPCRGASENVDNLTEDELNEALQVGAAAAVTTLDSPIWTPLPQSAGPPPSCQPMITGLNAITNNENFTEVDHLITSHNRQSVAEEGIVTVVEQLSLKSSTFNQSDANSNVMSATSMVRIIESTDHSALHSRMPQTDHSAIAATAQLTSQEAATVTAADDDWLSSCMGFEIIHDGVRMHEFLEYECSTCLMTLLNRRAAVKHIQTSDHGPSSIVIVNIYCCNNCCMRYRQKQDMWFHVTYLCGRKDKAIAKDEDYYECAICAKLFFSVNYLQRHIYLHHILVNGATKQSNMQQVTPTTAWSNATQVQQYENTANDASTAAAGLTNCNWVSSAHGVVSDAQVADEHTKCGVEGDEAPEESGNELGPQALLDLACSMVLHNDGNNERDGDEESNDRSSGKAKGLDDLSSEGASKAADATAAGAVRINRNAKGIVYKNVFMKCVVNYLCSICEKDLSTKESKKEHKTSSCFESGVRQFTYVRHYSYFCPYCGDKFPAQRLCRDHQLTQCLLVMGVKTEELDARQLLCPLCDKKYYNIISLKGHMTLAHKDYDFNSGLMLGGTTTDSGSYMSELLSFLPDLGVGGSESGGGVGEEEDGKCHADADTSQKLKRSECKRRPTNSAARRRPSGSASTSKRVRSCVNKETTGGSDGNSGVSMRRAAASRRRKACPSTETKTSKSRRESLCEAVSADMEDGLMDSLSSDLQIRADMTSAGVESQSSSPVVVEPDVNKEEEDNMNNDTDTEDVLSSDSSSSSSQADITQRSRRRKQSNSASK